MQWKLKNLHDAEYLIPNDLNIDFYFFKKNNKQNITSDEG